MDHAPEMHGHSHGHDHGHSHDHDHHHGGSDYYLQQLLTIFICGAFGVVGILMYFVPAGQGVTDDAGNPLSKLGVLLVPGFHPWVMAGSLLLLAVTIIRGVSLWRSAGAGHDHHHDHGHHHHDLDHKPGEKCDHPSHAHDHNHGHDHGDHSADDHNHGNIYWRVVVLLFPVVIYLMGLPNGTFSKEYQSKLVRGHEVGELSEVADKKSTGDVGFETLAAGALSPESREIFTGQTVTLNGQFKPLSPTQFTLFFFKMTCCAADQVPLKATCVVKDPTALQEVVVEGGKPVQRPLQMGQKVRVTGKVQFTQDSSTGEWVTVLRVDKGGVQKR
ncbi:MAG: hypothetical protein MUF18_14350 [Fimbriiglobus sp.]|nr:hypothetical protein [Fimbriiglobus sp.]